MPDGDSRQAFCVLQAFNMFEKTAGEPIPEKRHAAQKIFSNRSNT